MVIISKPFFYEKIDESIKCSEIHFWTDSCLNSNVWLIRNVFVGSLKFFLPIYVVKAILNRKKLKDKQFLVGLFLGEIRSAIYGVMLAHLFITSNCILSKLTGRLHYYNFALISGIISGLSVLVETKENRMLDTIIFFNLLIEAIFRNMDYFNIIKLTNKRETLIFMLVSGLLMHVLQNRKQNLKLTSFWFYTPHKFQETNGEIKINQLESKCIHKGLCENFSLEGTQKYFILGYGFSIVRKFIPRMLNVFKKPQNLLGILVNKDNFKFGMFIGAYVGLYRYIMCFLLKTESFNQKYFGAVAGLISGATYLISPNFQVITVGITTLFQIFYHYVLKKFHVKNQLLPQQIVYMLSHGLLFHNAVMSKETCPTYYVNMLNTCTNNIFWDIYSHVILKYLS